MRALFGLLALATAAAAQAEPPPLPAPLEGVVVDGGFQPGDLGWLRGRFADATDADKERLAEVRGWLERCGDAPLCDRVRDVATIDLPPETTFEEFGVALVEARPIVAAYRTGLERAALALLPSDAPDTSARVARAVERGLAVPPDWATQLGQPDLPPALLAALRLVVRLSEREAARALATP